MQRLCGMRSCHSAVLGVVLAAATVDIQSIDRGQLGKASSISTISLKRWPKRRRSCIPVLHSLYYHQSYQLLEICGGNIEVVLYHPLDLPHDLAFKKVVYTPSQGSDELWINSYTIEFLRRTSTVGGSCHDVFVANPANHSFLT
jgi:hypothetical protein